MIKKMMLAVASAAVAFLAISSTTNAATVTSLSDNFNSESQGLNYNSFANWDVSNGTVDLIGPGFFPLCGGSNCVDLDGSTGNAGDLTTKDAFSIGKYELTFRIAGSQRGQNADGVTVTFGDMNESFKKASTDPFELITRIVMLSSADFLAFSHAGGDNIGILLDDVTITAVPLPAALPLYGAGLGLLGYVGWRRKRKNAALAA